jgi:hypothetical protein
MEDAGGQFGPIPEANPTTEATANDVIQSNKSYGSPPWTYGGHSCREKLALEAKAA